MFIEESAEISLPPVEVQDFGCPRCGSALLTDGSQMWCTRIASRSGRSVVSDCMYGVDSSVPLPWWT